MAKVEACWAELALLTSRTWPSWWWMIVVVMMLIRVMMAMAIEGNEKPSLHGDDLQREGLSAPPPLCGRDTRDDGPEGSNDDMFLLPAFIRG